MKKKGKKLLKLQHPPWKWNYLLIYFSANTLSQNPKKAQHSFTRLEHDNFSAVKRTFLEMPKASTS